MDYFSSSSPSVSSQRILYTPSGFARTTLLYLQERVLLMQKIK